MFPSIFNFVRKKNWKLIKSNGHFTTNFGHFFGNYINIFQKTEIQTLILKYLVSQIPNWIKTGEQN